MAAILAVDDNSNNLYYLKNLLENSGHTVFTAINGSEGLAIAGNPENKIDMIISDIMMPVMNGYRFCREIKSNPDLKKILFVFYTATFVEKEDEILGLNLGASRFIIKPMESYAFILIINNILEKQGNADIIQIDEQVASNEELFNMYDGSVSRKLEETVIKLRNERNSLKESEELLNQAQEIGNIGHWLDNPKTGSIRWSDEFYRILGLKPHECEPAYEKFISIVHPDDREFVNKTYGDALMKKTSSNSDFRLVTGGGAVRYVNGMCQTVYDDDGLPQYTLGTLQDITDRKNMVNQLKTALDEKDVLLQELYHRTRNNMQVICSLLDFKSAHLNDRKALSIFKDISSRIQSMSLVHSKLYQSQNLSRIDFDDYILELVENLKDSYIEESKNIIFNFHLDKISTVIDTAIPCGLILTELISNSFKFAFHNTVNGEITIGLRRKENGNIELKYSDNGPGMPPGFDSEDSNTLGIRLINLLAMQLHSDFDMPSSGGMNCRIEFNDDTFTERV